MDRQTPIRAFAIGLAALIALVAGAVVTANSHDSDLAGLVALLLARYPGASVLCVIVAWASVLAGVLSVVAFYGAFSEETDRYDRKRFPRVVPVLFFLLSIGLIWVAFLCASRQPTSSPIADRPSPVIAAAPASEPQFAAPIESDKRPEEAPPRPEVSARALPLAWIYAEPLIFDGDWRASREAQIQLAALFPPADPDGSVAALLCDKAWVAFAGAASQEGPLARNERRARLRAELAAEAAGRWLEAQGSECVRPILLGIDLGQHEATLDDPEPRDSASQRQLLVVSRSPTGENEWLSVDQAVAEMRDFYADPAGRTVLLGPRRYQRKPVVFVAADPR
ncbi:MAG: hypothetical protein VX640_02500 [Pseudomonadota bacterium]|nr:hypothetical protein [Pseudomonadota bacterium]